MNQTPAQPAAQKFEPVEESKKKSARSDRVDWTPEQDTLLDSLAARFKGQNWAQVCLLMRNQFGDRGYTPKRCRTRWRNCVNPDINKGKLRASEELLVLVQHSIHKNDWAKISKSLPHRNVNVLRNNFYGVMRRVARRASIGKKCAKDIRPLYFLQTLYAAMFLLDLLDMPTPSPKNPVVPLYVFQRVLESKVTREACVEYAEGVRTKFLEQYARFPGIKELAKSCYLSLTTQFFPRFASVARDQVKHDTELTDSLILDMIEKAASLGAATKPVSPASSTFIKPLLAPATPTYIVLNTGPTNTTSMMMNSPPTMYSMSQYYSSYFQGYSATGPGYPLVFMPSQPMIRPQQQPPTEMFWPPLQFK